MKRTVYCWLGKATLGLVFFLFPLISFSQSTRTKIACIGNSVTFGLGHENPQQTSYPAVLQGLLGAEYTVKNFGHSGATLLRQGHNPYYKTKEFEQAIKHAADIAIIDLGLNDTDPRNWPNYSDQFIADYSWLIDTLRKGNPAMQIFVCKMTPVFPDHPRFKSGTGDWFWQIQEAVEKVAMANKTSLIDLHTALFKRPDVFTDALHPNEKGAAIIAKTIYQNLTGDFGGLQLLPVFSSHMVLQRNKPIKFYGIANRNEKILVLFNGKQRTSLANHQGKWCVEFPALVAGGPYKATIKSPAKTIGLEDILIGELWLCSGQSNMVFPLRSAINDTNEMREAQSNKTLRLLQMKPLAETDNKGWDSSTLDKVNRLEYFSGSWQRADSNKAKDFSAIAYYFAKQLQAQLKIPVGLIQVAVGGSTTESWIDRFTMEQNPVLVNEFSNWRKSDFFQPWVRERADTNLKNSSSSKQRHPYDPCYNYEAGIESFTGFPIRGVIWYQGESNAHNIELHEILFPALIKSWRKQWGYDFPFYYVQLSSLNRFSWPAFRNSQLHLLNVIPNTGMAVSSDVGDATNVHPQKKKEVGQRLARLALHFTYNRKDIIPCGPVPLKIIHQQNQLTITFKYAGSELQTRCGAALRGFVLVSDKGVSFRAKAFIQKNKIIIPVEGWRKIAELRYGWEPYTEANLVNEDRLPASTFRLKIQ